MKSRLQSVGLRTNGWATIKKEKETIIEITEKGKKALSEVTEVEKILHRTA